ncbi:MAG: RluA family pseudouridine synthase [Eubacteriales bacterium]|nr:RluA family pseudouridine synthase [Eubacteriales bacterium]
MSDYIAIKVNIGGERIDSFLSMNTDCSRSRIQSLIKDGYVTINGAVCKKNAVVATEDMIAVTIPDQPSLEAVPQDIPLDILYEDDDLCVVNKPQGMVVHPAVGNTNGTLVNALMYHIGTLSNANDTIRPGIVHRIDKFTSGLLVVAKNDYTHEELSKQFAEHSARRSYISLVHGNLREDSGTVNAPIARHRTDRKRMAVDADGKTAITHWKVLERFGSVTLLRLNLETGRTHQIRVHMAHIQHPVVGDNVYGSQDSKLGLMGQMLHGYRLQFVHPRTKKVRVFYASIPDYFLDVLRKYNSDLYWAKELFDE